MTADDVLALAATARTVHVAPSLKSYLVDLADATRRHRHLLLGMSPRATLSLQRVARALAASRGRAYVTPDDLKELAEPVLAHRLIVTPEAQLQGIRAADALHECVASIPVPAPDGA
ncbi:MAG: MoxR family ATPase [Acidimicrobiia bacterium]|nr:MoxR family ATPase [Acidimicrobiia bacterium]